MNKRLGQHFLKNKSAIKKIIDALEIKSGETIIEIGPGSGALTFPILEKCRTSNLECKIIAIEKDPHLVNQLTSKLVNWEGGVEIIHGDVLAILPGLINQLTTQLTNYKIVGNIPYYITGKLLRTISELGSKPSLTVLMIQKEVAERVVAQPPKMNLLAAATQFWARPKILFSLKPNNFDPPPKVDSTVIELKTKSEKRKANESENYYKLIRIIFKQPRKTLLNNLKSGLSLSKEEIEAALLKENLAPNARPQDLTLENIKNLTRVFHI